MGMVEIGDDGVLRDAVWHRQQGLRLLLKARITARWVRDKAACEPLYRSAISHLVDAFLHDRTGQANCFAYAHRAGAEISELTGCDYEFDPQSKQYRLGCPVFALHAFVGTSIAWSLSTACSICGAALFECLHVAGEDYHGETCAQQPSGVNVLDHIALTPNPDFAYTWHWPKQYSAEELVVAGTIKQPGDRAFCNHCHDCEGRWGPDTGDLNPVGRWRKVLAERRAAP